MVNGYSVQLSSPTCYYSKKTDTNKNLITETINAEKSNLSFFPKCNVDGTALISVVPINFYDKELGSVIAKLEYSGDEDVSFTLRSEGRRMNTHFRNVWRRLYKTKEILIITTTIRSHLHKRFYKYLYFI